MKVALQTICIVYRLANGRRLLACGIPVVSNSTDHPREIDPVQVIAAIGIATRGTTFTLAQLRQHCLVDAALNEVIGGIDPKKLGQLLQRAAKSGDVFGDFVVVRVRLQEHGSAVWQLLVV